jgi:hypothetical protein
LIKTKLGKQTEKSSLVVTKAKKRKNEFGSAIISDWCLISIVNDCALNDWGWISVLNGCGIHDWV